MHHKAFAKNLSFMEILDTSGKSVIVAKLLLFFTVAFFLPFMVFTPESYGYLDPGTGSMLVSAVVGAASGLIFAFKGLIVKSKVFFAKLFGKKLVLSEITELVIYSEGRQYTNTFLPVVKELTSRNHSINYLTSDENDPILLENIEGLSANYIGAGSLAFGKLASLEAKIVLSSTPGLDVLQFKRSKGAKHYMYLFHAPTDAIVYDMFAFDYFDSIMLSGAHQRKTIRELESVRNTRAKDLYDVGCLYYDTMMDKLQKMQQHQAETDPANSESSEHNSEFGSDIVAINPLILVAPTWGEKGLLAVEGQRLLSSLSNSSYTIVVRPHPQSSKNEKEMLDSLMKEFPDIEWDFKPDGFDSMSRASVLVSDFSGIIFDFGFLFHRPVMTYDHEPNLAGTESIDLPWEPWEFGVLDTLGGRFDSNDIDSLPEKISELLSSTISADIEKLRGESVFNFGKSATHAADVIEAKLSELTTQK